MRIHVGLEDLADLIRDLEAGFGRLAAGSEPDAPEAQPPSRDRPIS